MDRVEKVLFNLRLFCRVIFPRGSFRKRTPSYGFFKFKPFLSGCCLEFATNFVHKSMMAIISRCLPYLPLFWSLLLIVTVTMSRLMADASHTREALLKASYSMVQSIFSQFLDLLALVGIVSIVVRYLQLDLAIQDLTGEFRSRFSRLRSASVSLGLASMLGVTLVSNFRQPNHQVSLLIACTTYWSR